jgi:hypothetical protein
MKISPPITPPPLFFFKIPIVLLLDNFFSTLGSAIQFYFGGNKDFFRFLGFFGKKNLKTKKCVLGVKNEKSKYVFWMKMKSLRKESVLIS